MKVFCHVCNRETDCINDSCSQCQQQFYELIGQDSPSVAPSIASASNGASVKASHAAANAASTSDSFGAKVSATDDDFVVVDKSATSWTPLPTPPHATSTTSTTSTTQSSSSSSSLPMPEWVSSVESYWKTLVKPTVRAIDDAVDRFLVAPLNSVLLPREDRKVHDRYEPSFSFSFFFFFPCESTLCVNILCIYLAQTSDSS